MAQLPPKIPSAISNNWPYFAHHPALHAPASQPSWVDEFLDLPTGRLSHRRRSTSDSVAFLEAPLLDEGGGFDRLNDDEIMSMFSDEVPPPASPSTLSEHSGIHEDKPAAAGAEEAQSACKTQLEAAAEPLADAKRVKRQSAQRSRVRKLQYISELERSVTTLQTEVSELSPRVALLDHQRSILTIGNSHLKQRIAALAQDKIFKDAHQEALKKEIERLSQIYQQQNLDKMGASTKKELLS